MEKLNNKILVVEDDPDILELLRYNLHRAGYDTVAAHTGEQALEKATSTSCDVILLDVMLPGINGLDVCHHLTRNETTRETPIILVSAKGQDADILRGLHFGAIDYVTKPFSIHEILERVEAAARHRNHIPGPNSILRSGTAILDTRRQTLTMGDQTIQLDDNETALARVFFAEARRILTRSRIQSAMHKSGFPLTVAELENLIHTLRNKLGAHRDSIIPLRDIGYRFAGANKPTNRYPAQSSP